MLDRNIFIHSVPKGIRYISDWDEFEIFNFPHILDKQIPGCGFTEYCITNSENVILCSPRKILLKNKYDQHSEDVFLIDIGNTINVDLNLEVIKIRSRGQNSLSSQIKPKQSPKPLVDDSDWNTIIPELNRYISGRLLRAKPIKILVTYDSFRRLKEVLDDILKSKKNYPQERLDYRVVIDEFQSIFTDSRFKSTTELEFLLHLQGIERVCYVSATPMIKEYLSKLDEFKDLPYYELDWKTEDPSRVNKPTVAVRQLKSVKLLSRTLVDPYIKGEYYRELKEDPLTGETKEFISKELVIYVNSVNNIITIIKGCRLRSDQVNILCANTEKNKLTIKELNRKSNNLGDGFKIGSVPLKGEPRKLVTLCTRTVYLGADFYSDNARSIVISDANIECMAVDITLDLPQILGRQRLSENPWKNEIEIYVKCIMPGNSILKEDFERLREEKWRKTESVLSLYNKTTTEVERETYIDFIELSIKTFNFRKDYVAVNKHAGKQRIPVVNKLVQIAEERAFDIQQVDYASRFMVFSSIKESLKLDSINDITSSSYDVERFLDAYSTCLTSSDRLKVICEFKFSNKQDQREAFLNYVPLSYRNYYYGLGPETCKKLGYNISRVKSELQRSLQSSSNNTLINKITSSFEINTRASKSYIKSKLKEIYSSLSYDKTPKASDLEEWFDIKPCKIKNEETGKWEHGFEIIKVKS